LVWPTDEDLGGQVPAWFAAERALNGDGLEREFREASGYIAAATLAGYDEQSPLDVGEPKCHTASIGEKRAKLIHSQDAREKWSITATPHAREASGNETA
jgi:hypothetical protein